MTQDFNPTVGRPEPVGPGIRRILAPNPSPMTWRGTNTYLIGDRDIAVIDPGPDSGPHLTAILNALGPGQRISHILVTHAHLDHSPLARPLAERTGAPVLAFGPAGSGRSPVMQAIARDGAIAGGEGVDHSFVPDRALADGERLLGADWGLTALWTPGHFGNHLCFEMDGVLFSGDLVMGWASSLVSPPDGDLTDFMASCRRLRGRRSRVMHAGHGAPVTDPQARLDWLIAHRQSREAAILARLAQGAANAPTLAQQIYTDTPPALLPAATRNILAHLIDLSRRNICHPTGRLTADAIFHLASASPMLRDDLDGQTT